MKVSAITLCSCLLLSACEGAPLGEDPDGGTPPNGVYQLTATPIADDCTPRVATPPAQQVFLGVHSPAALSVAVPNPAFGQPVQSWSVEPLQDGRFAADVTVCGAVHSRLLELQHLSASHLTVRQTETFSGIAHVDPTCSSTAPLPQRDCTSSAELRYDLVLACAPPCVVELKYGLDGKAVGACDCRAK
jgi:hypothetical protein